MLGTGRRAGPKSRVPNVRNRHPQSSRRPQTGKLELIFVKLYIVFYKQKHLNYILTELVEIMWFENQCFNGQT